MFLQNLLLKLCWELTVSQVHLFYLTSNHFHIQEPQPLQDISHVSHYLIKFRFLFFTKSLSIIQFHYSSMLSFPSLNAQFQFHIFLTVLQYQHQELEKKNQMWLYIMKPLTKLFKSFHPILFYLVFIKVIEFLILCPKYQVRVLLIVFLMKSSCWILNEVNLLNHW